MSDWMKTGGYAFPTESGNGMYLRDYFAALAMQSLLSAGKQVASQMLAKEAYKLADAMVVQRRQL